MTGYAGINLTGTVKDNPEAHPPKFGTKKYASFSVDLPERPWDGQGDLPPMMTLAVSCAGELADEVLRKVIAGDRVTISGRLGVNRGKQYVYAAAVGLDLRSVEEPERS